MHFDDRLATVLRQRASSAVIARIQYRQLLDLLGTMPNDVRGEAVDAAFGRLAELSRTIAVADRANILLSPGLRLRSARLVAALADGEPAVAAAAVAAASLSQDEWLDLTPALPVHARGFMRLRRDLAPRVSALLERLGVRDRGLPSAWANDSAQDPPAPDEPESPATSGIGAIVRRIEAYRKTREAGEGAWERGDAPRLPLGEAESQVPRAQLSAFDFATDATGRIVWADAEVAPALVGMLIDSGDTAGSARPSQGVRAALRHRLPITRGGIELDGAPAIAGLWRVDAIPRFDSPEGRFTGYAGRMRRAASPAVLQPPPAAKPADSQADRVRQLLHELRTPVNAIQGFAEVIHQQLFGPTPHEYRALAANIAGDAARLLAGFEELDRLAKLESGALEPEAGICDMLQVLRNVIAQLEPYTSQRQSGFVLKSDGENLLVALAPAEAERLAWRLLATLASAAGPGEPLRVKVSSKGDMIALALQLPASLAALESEALFHAVAGSQAQTLSAGMFGIGFTLRLAAAETRGAGGLFEHAGDRLRLRLPALSAANENHNQSASKLS